MGLLIDHDLSKPINIQIVSFSYLPIVFVWSSLGKIHPWETWTKGSFYAFLLG